MACNYQYYNMFKECYAAKEIISPQTYPVQVEIILNHATKKGSPWRKRRVNNLKFSQPTVSMFSHKTPIMNK